MRANLILHKLPLTDSVPVEAKMASIDRVIKNYLKNILKLFIKLAQNSVFHFDTGKHQLPLPED